ncbi:DUF4124 domain-containing protein [uncultured Photobacterium sp.]|uniref:DUF4124 domain-containing protein n=1 Tax=uncultured Photobacterium sp. TaxID=173973 RepID=UPI0026045CE3|nr:DUF4124 domain-containing protein [uncultured Photobacterium sp.]
MKTARYTLILFIILTSLTTATQATTIYTWEDENGVVHFSDQARPGASTVDINVPPPSSIAPNSQQDKNPSTKTPATPIQQNDASLPPATVRLLSPLHEQTIRNNEGIIEISAVSNRKLTKGHNARLLLNGQPYGRPQAQLNWQLHNVDRGSHTLQAQILKYGKVIASSDIITVYLHRASLLNRKPPVITPK